LLGLASGSVVKIFTTVCRRRIWKNCSARCGHSYNGRQI